MPVLMNDSQMFSRNGKRIVRRLFYLFLLCSSCLYCFACSVPSSLTIGNGFGSSRKDFSLEPVAEPKTIVHPITHPIPALHNEYGKKTDPLPEISPDYFLVNSVHQGQVNALAVSKDGQRAYSGGQDGKVVVSTLVQANSESSAAGDAVGFPKRFVESDSLLAGDKPVIALSLSPDEEKLAVSQFSSVAIFDLRNREVTNVMTRVKGRITALAWDPRGELLVMGTANGDVFVWNLKGSLLAGLDNVDTLEEYQSATSPIVGLVFHPSGRAFFAAERSGGVYLWRLLRTEKELGLRDETALVDQEKKGGTRQRVGALKSEIADIWLDHSASHLFAAGADGTISLWKIRGLKRIDGFTIDVGSLFSMQGFRLPRSGSFNASRSQAMVSLLAITGKNQRIKIWCEKPPRNNASADSPPAVAERAANSPESNREEEYARAAEEPGSPDGSIPNLEAATSGGSVPVSDPSASIPQGFVAQSILFRNPLTIIRTGQDSALLWAVEKTGNVLTFDANLLVKSPIWMSRSQLCLD